MSTAAGTYTMKQAVEHAGFGRYHWWLLMLTGSVYGIDASQGLMQAFLIPTLKDVWDLESPWDSMIGIAFYAGAFFGTIVWAKLADIHGRRPVIIFCMCLIAVSTTATAMMTDIYGVIVCRFITGCGNCSAVAITLFMEYSPMDSRAKSILCQEGCWTAAGILTILLAWLVFPNPNMDEYTGWRVYVLACSIPAWFMALASFWVPESARWYNTVGDFDNAEEALRQVLVANKVKLLEGRLYKKTKSIAVRGEIKDLFVPEYCRTSVLMTTNQFIGIMTYLGVVFLSERVFEDSSLYLCELLTNLSEIPGLAIALFALNRAGRKGMMIYTRTIVTAGFAVVLLLWQTALNESYVWVIMVIAVFCVRSAANINITINSLYAAEYYPTAIRTTGLGFVLSFARLGAIGSTFVSEDLNISTSTTVFTIVSAIGIASSFLLQQDTTKREMTDKVDRSASQSTSTASLSKGWRSKEYVLFSSV